MRRLAWAPIAITLPFLLTACGGIIDSGGQTAGDLTGVTWVLDRASMMTLVGSVPKGARIDISFDGSRASGLAACNQYGGGYRADAAKGSLSFEAMASTQMACADGDLMTLEAAYLSALGDVTGYQVTGDRAGLQLLGGTAALTYEPEQPATPLALEGTAWKLTTIAQPDTQAVSSTVAGTKVTLSMQGGAATGSGGCNSYHAAYEATGGDGLTFGPIGSTMMACSPRAVADQEQAYFAALGKVGTFAIEGDQLSLFDAGGQLLLGFAGRSGS